MLDHIGVIPEVGEGGREEGEGGMEGHPREEVRE